MISRSFQSSAEAERTLLMPCLKCEWVDVSVFFFLCVMMVNGLLSSMLSSKSSFESCMGLGVESGMWLGVRFDMPMVAVALIVGWVMAVA